MDDNPPPPYSIRDPQSATQSQDITAFNAFRDGTPAPVPELLIKGPSGHSFVPARYSVPTPSLESQYAMAPANPQARRVSNEELERAGFVSAAPYFQLRTPPNQATPHDKFYHHMAISPDARPDNLPFPQPAEKWLSRGVDNQDWLTFLNHLFPPYTTNQNGDRGGQQLQVDADLDIGHLRLSKSRSRDQSRPLLENPPWPSSGNQEREFKQLRRVKIEAVTSQWNEGFFGPRGLEIFMDIVDIASPITDTSRRSSGRVLQKQTPPQMEETLLHQACAKGKKSQVRELLDRGNEDIEALNKKGQTALFLAVSRGEKEICQILLDHNADPTARPPDSISAIHTAVYNDRKTILKMLLARSRVGLEERNAKDETPLWVAVNKRHHSCIEALLDAGANPNAHPIGKDSMLNLVVSGDQKSITKLLLQRGVDIEERNSNGEGPLFRAGKFSASFLLLIVVLMAPPLCCRD